jgi:hypothetical protein
MVRDEFLAAWGKVFVVAGLIVLFFTTSAAFWAPPVVLGLQMQLAALRTRPPRRPPRSYDLVDDSMPPVVTVPRDHPDDAAPIESPPDPRHQKDTP